MKPQHKEATVKYLLTPEDLAAIVATNHQKVLSELNTLKKQGHISRIEYTYYDRKQKDKAKNRNNYGFPHAFTIYRSGEKVVRLCTDLAFIYQVMYENGLDTNFAEETLQIPLASLSEYEKLSAELYVRFMRTIKQYLMYNYFTLVYTSKITGKVFKQISVKLAALSIQNKHNVYKSLDGSRGQLRILLFPWLYKVIKIHAQPPSPEKPAPRG
jgi:hypothetical protein